MNYFQAVKLLDEVRDGRDHTTASITIALRLVGDIDADLCGISPGEWRSSPKGWSETIFDTPI